MALDEPNDKDEVFTQGSYSIVMERELFNQAKPLRIDVSYMGFSVESSLQLGGGGCSSGSCSGGSCSV
ncbi:hypothetical protein JCM14635_18990 [Megalodesulfovibrio paquesii]